MRNKKKWITHEELHRDLMRDREYRREYKRLEPEFQIAKQMIGSRIKQKISQSELAKKAGTGQAVISRLEGMNASPSLSLLKRVAQALNTKLQITIQ